MGEGLDGGVDSTAKTQCLLYLSNSKTTAKILAALKKNIIKVKSELTEILWE